ncbi:MAG: hypothetical protein ACHQ1E_02190, partial [Ktedonobacterales bacterium]
MAVLDGVERGDILDVRGLREHIQRLHGAQAIGAGFEAEVGEIARQLAGIDGVLLHVGRGGRRESR